MKVVTAPNATADRLADAALLLLDAARAAIAEQAAAGSPSMDLTANVTAIAVQAVVLADHWPARGLDSAGVGINPVILVDTIRGAGVGLGMVLANVPDRSVQGSLAVLLGSALGEGQRLGNGLRETRKGGAS